MSDETKRKIGDKQRGPLNHRYGKHFTEEQRQNRSKILKELGIRPPVKYGPMSEETKAKISAANRGRRRSDETCQKISTALKGKKRRSPSPETIEKIRQGNLRFRAQMSEFQKEMAAQRIRNALQKKANTRTQKRSRGFPRLPSSFD